MPPLASKRLYFRDLPANIGEAELTKYFSSYGTLVEVKVLHNYAFIQFESEKHAKDVHDTYRRQTLWGKNVVVEFARPLRKDLPSIGSSNSTDSAPEIRARLAPPHIQSRYPIVVTNISREIRWQELKDFGRLAGGLVAYCDLDKKRRGRGFIEYFSREDADNAIKTLNGQSLGGTYVKVFARDAGRKRPHARSRSRSPVRSYSGRSRSSTRRASRHATSQGSPASSSRFAYTYTPTSKDTEHPAYSGYEESPATDHYATQSYSGLASPYTYTSPQVTEYPQSSARLENLTQSAPRTHNSYSFDPYSDETDHSPVTAQQSSSEYYHNCSYGYERYSDSRCYDTDRGATVGVEQVRYQQSYRYPPQILQGYH